MSEYVRIAGMAEVLLAMVWPWKVPVGRYW